MCVLCSPEPTRIWHDGELVRGLWDGYPVTPGHALLVTRRHVSTWFDATADEQAAILSLVSVARGAVAALGHAPDGWNVGFNAGRAAGQTVDHLHVHVIPRYAGDVPDPRGGVRWVVPERADYWSVGEAVLPFRRVTPDRAIVSGGTSDPLLQHLRTDFASSSAVDIAVAFVVRSGVALVLDEMERLLARGGRLRLLAGDYLDVTDPDALQLLLGLQGNRQIRVFETSGSSTFHPKTYIFGEAGQARRAYVGSSNLTSPGLDGGIEWNLRSVSGADGGSLRDISLAFEDLWRDPSVRPVDGAWIESYRARRRPRPLVESRHVPPTPRDVQVEALDALRQTREAGNTAGLVVLATGLGKTFLAAFDSVDRERVLFVAHREEILDQARRAFERVRGPGNRVAVLDSGSPTVGPGVTVASIQFLSRSTRLTGLPRDAWDYVVIDEFHHAHAPTYRRVIDWLQPEFLLGLTATPVRSDGADLLALCGNNLVYECDLFTGSSRSLLCKVSYLGIADAVDYAAIPWRNGKFATEDLESAVASQVRAQDAYDNWRARRGRRTLAFCVSQRHADFMRDFFQARGVLAASVHGGPLSDGRASVNALRSGDLEVLFSVDMLNEGLDVPEIDTVLMLRPTDSETLFLQQLGRGLRLDPSAPDKVLQVIDFIGNHRVFLRKAATLLRAASGDVSLDEILKRRSIEPLRLSPNFEVVYELAAIDILRKLAQRRSPTAAFEAWYVDFKAEHQRRPTALETLHAGFSLDELRSAITSWIDFVAGRGDLEIPLSDEASTHFLRHLEVTKLTKSFKPAVLGVMVSAGQMPGSMAVADLAAGFSRLAHRGPRLRREIEGPDIDDHPALAEYLVKNPLRAWSNGAGVEAPFFNLVSDRFSTAFDVEDELRSPYALIVQELVDYRLALHFGRRRIQGLHAVAADGRRLDAEFSVERVDASTFHIVMESRGGTRGSETERNPDYAATLEAILTRLGGSNATLEAADLATKESTAPLVLSLPIALKGADAHALRRAISAAQGSNPTRRIRLRVTGLDMSEHQLERLLVGAERAPR